jgi:hypothetical protein
MSDRSVRKGAPNPNLATAWRSVVNLCFDHFTSNERLSGTYKIGERVSSVASLDGEDNKPSLLRNQITLFNPYLVVLLNDPSLLI